MIIDIIIINYIYKYLLTFFVRSKELFMIRIFSYSNLHHIIVYTHEIRACSVIWTCCFHCRIRSRTSALFRQEVSASRRFGMLLCMLLATLIDWPFIHWYPHTARPTYWEVGNRRYEKSSCIWVQRSYVMFGVSWVVHGGFCDLSLIFYML